MCFMWGFQDSGVNTQIQETLGFEFDNSSSEPFSIYNIMQCLACFIFQILESYVHDKAEYRWFTLGVCLICFFSNGLVYFFPFREELANKNDVIGPMIHKAQSIKKSKGKHSDPNAEQAHLFVQPAKEGLLDGNLSNNYLPSSQEKPLVLSSEVDASGF